MKKFITYLDAYKEIDDIQPIQYISILDQINMHFIKNRISKIDEEIHNPISNYSLWQNNHDFTYQLDYLQPSFFPIADPFENINIKPILKKPKEYKNIDMKIESIQDLLSIIEKYPYDDSFQYNIDIRILHSIKNELFDLVVTRDNVGEFMWYMYTGILLTSIVQLKITTRGCASNPKTMEQNYQKFKEFKI